MTTRARVETDLAFDGLRIALTREQDGQRIVRVWDDPAIRVLTAGTEPGPDEWLRLSDDEARAVYSALADHYGHAANDVRLLRADYEAERARVDRLLEALARLT